MNYIALFITCSHVGEDKVQCMAVTSIGERPYSFKVWLGECRASSDETWFRNADVGGV